MVTLACVGCGEDATDEPTLGQSREGDAVTVQRNEKKIKNLKREVAREQAAARRGRQTRPSDASGGLAGFDAFASSQDGEVGVAVGSPGRGPVAVAGNLPTGAAWSTIKVPIAARVMLDKGGAGSISSAERSLIERAITASDNAAAAELWSELSKRHGGAEGAATAVSEVLASAGDTATVVSTVGRDGFSPYGQTDWSLEAQERFMAALAGGCLDPAAGGDFLLDTMSRVVSSQRWGLGSIASPARLKGGWGPGTDGRYLVRQMGVLDLPQGQLVVAVAALPSDGSLSSGTAMLDRVASWLSKNAGELAGQSAC
jgi:hypothetical protein